METHGTARHDQVIAILRAGGFQIDRAEFSNGTGLVIASRPAMPPAHERQLSP